jgi:formylglycine-generating enzyme required for sulfatase activity
MKLLPDSSFEYDVFICHSSKDKPIITTLIEDLKKENITYWVDAEQIEFGDSITEKITEGLETSKYVIPCLSKNLKNSGWTRAEYGSILNAEFSGNSKKRVIPFLLEDCDVNDIPTLLRDKKRVTYSNKTEFNEFINFLKNNRLSETETNSLTASNGVSYFQSRNPEISKTFISPSTGIEFVLIPEGEFIMGSENLDNEKPAHKVKIKNSFYLGKYLVTHKQWKTIMDSDFPSSSKDNYPVGVSWNEAIEFIKKLNMVEGENKYRLPSEAEWEYACRAGTTTRYFFGDDESKLGDCAWYGFRNLFGHAHPVGEKKPNPLGLYDVYGNIEEWCQDKWHDNYDVAPSDGSAWEDGSSSNRVCRGGMFNCIARDCRSASRKKYNSGKRRFHTGFRVVRGI